MSTDLNLDSIEFQGNVRSKPVRQNFTDIQNNFNSLRLEFATSVSSTATEITNARDNLGALDDNIHLRAQNGSYVNTGGIVTAQGTPDNTIRIASGSGMVDGLGVSFLSATSAVIGVATTGRLDVVAINNDNTLSIELGNDSADKILPVLASTQRPLAFIIQDTANPLTIATADITEIRRQGCYANGKWFFKIQDAVNYISSGEIKINAGSYYEEIDLTGKSDIQLTGQKGVKIYRPSATEYAIKSVNTVGNETTGIKIKDISLFGNSKAGAIELLKFEYTDKFLLDGIEFDGNASSTATYKDFLINQCDDFRLDNNIIDNYGTTTSITNATKYFEDGYFMGQVVYAGTTAQKTELVKMGFTELTAAANSFPRIESTAGNTGGADSSAHTHSHSHTVDSHSHLWFDSNDLNNNAGGFDSGGTFAFFEESISTGSAAKISMATVKKNVTTGRMKDDVDFYTNKIAPGTDVDATAASATDNKPVYYSLIALIHR